MLFHATSLLLQRKLVNFVSLALYHRAISVLAFLPVPPSARPIRGLQVVSHNPSLFFLGVSQGSVVFKTTTGDLFQIELQFHLNCPRWSTVISCCIPYFSGKLESEPVKIGHPRLFRNRTVTTYWKQLFYFNLLHYDLFNRSHYSVKRVFIQSFNFFC